MKGSRERSERKQRRRRVRREEEIAERKERRGGSEGKRGRRMEKDGTEISHLFFRLGKECLMVKKTQTQMFFSI